MIRVGETETTRNHPTSPVWVSRGLRRVGDRRIGVYIERDTLPMIKSVYRVSLAAGALLTLAGCSAFEGVPAAQPTDEYVLACEKVEQPGCETRAEQLCPEGYDTLSSEEDFARKELRVRCTGEANPP